MKLSVLLIGMLVIIGCNRDADDDLACGDIITMEGRYDYAEFYDEPKTGLSCAELREREYISQGNSSCSGDFEIQPVNLQVNSTQQSFSSLSKDRSRQNTIVDGVGEGARLVFNEKYNFYTYYNQIIVRGFNDKILARIKTKTSDGKLILFEKRLVVSDSTILEIFDISDIQNSKLVFEKNNLYFLNIKEREGILHLRSSGYYIDDEAVCEKIQYFDSSKQEAVTFFYEIDLNQAVPELANEKIFYGYFVNHIDLENTVTYRSINNYFGGPKTLFISEEDEKIIVDGRVRSPFALKFKDQNLMAFMGSVNWSRGASLITIDESFRLINQIENIAPEEFITTERFTKDYAYLVTYEQIDPLFVFDIADPLNPELMGELKMPGIMSYLHPLKNDLLLGIGNWIEMSNGETPMRGTEISLFDVGDPGLPAKIDALEFDYSLWGEDGAHYSTVNVFNDYVSVSGEKGIHLFKIDGRTLKSLGMIDYRKMGNPYYIEKDKLHLFEGESMESFNLKNLRGE